MIEKKNKKIIACLRNNARMPLTEMSKKIGVPVSTIFDRLKQNENNTILRHTCLLNYSELGFNTRANITIKVDKNHKEELKNFLISHQHINSVFRINNGFDFMVEGIFREIKDMEDFIDTIESKYNITDIKSHFIIDDIKREGFLADSEAY